MDIRDISRLGPAAQRQIREKLGAVETPEKRPSKYRNVPTTVSTGTGVTHTFDSKKEADHFQQLRLLERTGTIRNLKLQPQFTLQESYVAPDGTRVRAIRYVADFSYEQQDHGLGQWVLVVEDVKSRPTKTPQYNLKKKLMAEKFGIIVSEI